MNYDIPEQTKLEWQRTNRWLTGIRMREGCDSTGKQTLLRVKKYSTLTMEAIMWIYTWAIICRTIHENKTNFIVFKICSNYDFSRKSCFIINISCDATTFKHKSNLTTRKDLSKSVLYSTIILIRILHYSFLWTVLLQSFPLNPYQRFRWNYLVKKESFIFQHWNKPCSLIPSPSKLQHTLRLIKLLMKEEWSKRVRRESIGHKLSLSLGNEQQGQTWG